MKQTVIGLDIGTTSICGVAVGASGDLIASVERPNDSVVSGLPPRRAEQEPGQIRARAVEVLRELASRVGGGVSAIGLTGQMHGMLCVDRDSRPLSPLITWQDGRCLEKAPSGESWLEQMRSRAGAGSWDTCGCEPASGFLGSTLYWICQNGAAPAGTQRVCFIHDWLAGELCGQLPVTDPSDAGSSGIFDLSEMRWHERIVRELDLPADLLPPVHESGEVIGKLSPAMAETVGFAAGTPVCNAVGDNQASVIGSIADVNRSVLINLGTGGQISWAIPAFRRVPGMETRYLPGGRFMLVGASLCGGRAYAWLNDVVRSWLGEFGCSLDRETVYARLNERAASASADQAGLTAVTTFAGTRSDPSVRGSLAGISLENFSLGNAARAMLAGMVDELCAMYDRAGGKDAYGHDRVVASGNAVRKNPLLAGVIGGRTGSPVLIPRHREEAAFGAGLLAGVGAGLWGDLEAAGRAVRYG